ncbi:MAG: hypothetical protein CBC71_06325 [Rhodobacteraceae bacterium TMED111]|nr:hypothetical protein [Marinovum sp.]OUV41114.1 MAG: hypothetical protein CBC71_06325 [Rhodobacteraceae bacterium TMED111]|tara:strand:+ start:6812 stop:7243 length:432 start_codon:yes stop_codon:yes gene_type:complete
MIVRQAKSTEIPRIIELYRESLDEIGVKHLDSLTSKTVTDNFFQAPCFLLEIDGIIRGIAGLTISFTPWSGEATLRDYMFYIQPEYRNDKSLGGLVNSCKEFAKKLGVNLQVSFIVKNDEKLRQRVLKKYGFEVKTVIGEYHG